MQCPATAPPGVNLSPFHRAAQDYISLPCSLDQPQSASQPPELIGKPTEVGVRTTGTGLEGVSPPSKPQTPLSAPPPLPLALNLIGKLPRKEHKPPELG